jgi:hypothetical protein
MTFFLLEISSTGMYTGSCTVVPFLKSCRKSLFLELIHQLRLLGSQQHRQIGVLLTSFSTWGTENILAETNLESTGVIKSCNFLRVKNWQTLAALWARALSCNKKKSPLSETEELQSWGCSKILLSFLIRFEGHF